MKIDELNNNIRSLKRMREQNDSDYTRRYFDNIIEILETDLKFFPDCSDCHGSGSVDCYCSDCRSKGIVGKATCVMCNGIGKLDKT